MASSWLTNLLYEQPVKGSTAAASRTIRMTVRRFICIGLTSHFRLRPSPFTFCLFPFKCQFHQPPLAPPPPLPPPPKPPKPPPPPPNPPPPPQPPPPNGPTPLDQPLHGP